MLSENNNLDVEQNSCLGHVFPCKSYVKNLSLIFSLMDVAVECSCCEEVAPVRRISMRDYVDNTMGSGCLPAIA